MESVWMKNKSRFLFKCFFIRPRKNILAIPLLFCFTLTACIKIGTNADQDSKCWGGFKKGQVYRLKMDVFSVPHVFFGSLGGEFLTPPAQLFQKAGLYNAPETISAYKENPERHKYVKNILEKEDKIIVDSLRVNSGWSFMTGSVKEVNIYARHIRTGKKFEVSDLMTRHEYIDQCGYIPSLDDRILKLEDK